MLSMLLGAKYGSISDGNRMGYSTSVYKFWRLPNMGTPNQPKINSFRIETHGDDWGSAILSTPLSAIYEILSLPTIIPSWAGPARRPGHLPRLHEACSARTNANVQLPCRWGRRNSAKNSLNTSLKFRI